MTHSRREELRCGESGAIPVKLALEEWRHWLEGAERTFLMNGSQKRKTCRSFEIAQPRGLHEHSRGDPAPKENRGDPDLGD